MSDSQHAVHVSAETEDKFYQHAAVMLAGLAMLQHFQMKNRPVAGEIWTPMVPEEDALYGQLRAWWEGIGQQKRETVLNIAVGLSQRIGKAGH